jgi:hypothetical protein
MGKPSASGAKGMRHIWTSAYQRRFSADTTRRSTGVCKRAYYPLCCLVTRDWMADQHLGKLAAVARHSLDCLDGLLYTG